MKFASARKFVIATLLAGSLAACSAIGSVGTTVGNLVSVLNSDAGQAFISALGVSGTVTKGIQNVITTIDTGISSPGAQKSLQMVCYALPWADGALDAFAPAAHLDPRVVADTDAAVSAFLNGPCTNPPLNIGDAIVQGTNLYVAISQQLRGVGVPVAIPAQLARR